MHQNEKRFNLTATYFASLTATHGTRFLDRIDRPILSMIVHFGYFLRLSDGHFHNSDCRRSSFRVNLEESKKQRRRPLPQQTEEDH